MTNQKDKNTLDPAAPVIIGGLGGSGTRVVARLIEQCGYYLGPDRNEEYDNLWFTLLFKRPSCLREHTLVLRDPIHARLDLFTRCMLGQGPGFFGSITILNAAREMSKKGHNYLGDGKGRWAFDRARNMIHADKPNEKKFSGWGWKEPNTHIYLPYLIPHFQNMKYIHVMRHGLDMAYSRNQQQLRLWAPIFDIILPENPEPNPQLMLYYWLRANRRAIWKSEPLGKKRFYLLNFDKLCAHPKEETEKLIQFLQADKTNQEITDMSEGIKTPETTGRYKGKDLSIFPEKHLAGVRELGFTIEN